MAEVKPSQGEGLAACHLRDFTTAREGRRSLGQPSFPQWSAGSRRRFWRRGRAQLNPHTASGPQG